MDGVLMQQNVAPRRAKLADHTVGDLMPMRRAPDMRTRIEPGAFTIRAFGMQTRFPALESVPRCRQPLTAAGPPRFFLFRHSRATLSPDCGGKMRSSGAASR